MPEAELRAKKDQKMYSYACDFAIIQNFEIIK